MERSLTSLRSEVARRQAITPFICSTFKDFSEERDHLVSIVFPKLNTLCQERGSRFIPVDLRWSEESKGLTSNSCLVLQQCFDAIEQCSPYFICLLGERYGAHRPPNHVSGERIEATAQWLDKNFEMAALSGDEWLRDEENKHCSITELEIIKASFRERTQHGYFYFRHAEHIHKREQGQDVSQRARLMDIYESESDFAATKIKQLKQQIIDTDLPVKYFTSVHELGALVLKDWCSVLNSVYPAIEKKIFFTTAGEDFREWSSHETFAETRRKVFVATQSTRITCDVLTRHARNFFEGNLNNSSSGSLANMNDGTFLTSVAGMETFPSIVALIGDRGCGVSAILANWIAKFTRENPTAVVISHYTESGQRAADVTSFMRRCTRELRAEFRGSNSADEPDFLDLTDFETIAETFRASLSLGPCIILLDGLSHLSSCQTIPAHVIKQLAWLPNNLPPSCRIVVSATRSDISCKHLIGRDDVHVIDVPSLQSNDDKARVLLAWLGKHARYLDSRDYQAAILAGKLSGSPLYHVALANEFRLCGSARVSERQLEMYTRARNFACFWSAAIHRWSNDYSWLKPASLKGGVPVKMQVSKDRLNNGWIPDALRLISVSREGLIPDELTKILRAFGYCREHEISPAAWRLFTSAARNAMYVRADGQLSFQHASMREAVDFLLLNGLTSPSHVRRVTSLDNYWEVQKFQYHSVLNNSFAIFQCDERLVSELPWQHKAAGDVEGLRKSLARPEVFVTMWSNRRDLRAAVDFVNYWIFLNENGFDAVDTYVAMVAEAGKTQTVGDNQERLVDEDTSFDEKRSIAHRISKSAGAKYTSVEVAFLAYLAGRYFLGLQKLVPAESMLLKAFKLARNVTSIDDVDFLCMIQRSMGDLYYEGKLLEKAVVCYEGVLRTASEVTRNVNTDEVEFLALQAHVYNRLATISVRKLLSSVIPSTVPSLYGCRKNHEIKNDGALVLVPKVRDLLDEASRLTELVKLDKGKTSLYHTKALLAICEQRCDDAEMLFNRAVDEMEKWYGPSHPVIAMILQDLARYHHHSDYKASDVVSRSEKTYRRVLKIREAKLGRSHLDVSETLVDLGCLLQMKGTRDGCEEARYMLERAVDIRTEKLGIYHERTKEIRRILVKL